MNNINWENIDWENLRNIEIANQFNISSSLISSKRKKYAKDTIGKFKGAACGTIIGEKINDPDLVDFLNQDD